ncbi:pathogenesis-related protein PRB1-3-like [Heracleum sosnowskyi]|uniref:Pathogenesis-related protein PRB1-3-like n=1 Tax=Heracleum sosnowskyi TaxID=360622 RepID=A0AAD8MKM6_9APIA|nr:pathogenesis-related protein PRB1-3-like [Heracleum sosnowskyi]
MPRLRIGMSHSLLPLILSSLFITTCAIPRVPDPIGFDINVNFQTPTETHLQDGFPNINLPFTTPEIPTVPVPQVDIPNILQTIPQPPQDPSISNTDDLHTVAKEFLDLHNFARRHARLPPYIWNVTLEDYARQYANKRAEGGDCKTLVHSMGPYGENLFWGRGSSWKPRDAVRKWIKEHRYYDSNANECKYGKVCGHYTQVVWRDSIRLGCAVAICPNNDTFTVCSYDPPGNYLGEKPAIHYDH